MALFCLLPKTGGEGDRRVATFTTSQYKRETVESISCRNSHATPFTVCLRSLFFGCKQREREKRERVSFQTALKK